MNSNDLITMVNTYLPVVANSALAIKLIDCVKDVITTLYEPRLVYRKKKAKYQAEIEMKQSTGEEIVFTRSELVRLKNFLKAANFANEELASRTLALDEDTGTSTDSSADLSMQADNIDDNPLIDFDWIMRFFDAVSLVSTEQLQQLWGKILSNEITEPGSISLRTLDIVRNLTASEARSFDELCRYVMESGNILFIFENGFSAVPQEGEQLAFYNVRSNELIRSRNLNYLDHINPLIEAGLMVTDHDFVGVFNGKEMKLQMFNQNLVAVVVPKDNYKTVEFQPYMLTKCGTELYKAISSKNDFNPEIQYNVYCLRELQALYPDAEFLIFEKNDDEYLGVSNRFDE